MVGEGDDADGHAEPADDYSLEGDMPEGEVDPRGNVPSRADADDRDAGVHKDRDHREEEAGEPADSERDDGTDDEDDGGLEVDVVDGVTRLAKPGVLKREAKSLLRLITHRRKNPYCKSCVRAKMKHFKTNKGAFRRKLKKFGDLVTFDFMNTQKMIREGMMTDKDILVIRDRYTGIIYGGIH